MKKTTHKAAWRESLESLVVAILVALMLRSFVLEAFKIPSGSMIPSLAIGDQIFVNKFIYGIRIPFTTIRLVDFKTPQRGDVVVFICPVGKHEDYIKRVIGLPGDTIEVKNGLIYVNEKAIERTSTGPITETERDGITGDWHAFHAESYQEKLGTHTYTVLQDIDLSRRAADYGPYQVPQHHVFMMGDNRDHSSDSRAWGPVPLNNVLGQSMFVWWSWSEHGLNSRRLGHWID